MWYQSRASSPQHIEHKYTPGASSPQLKEQKLMRHQALNVLSINTLPGHQALNLKSKSSQGIKPSIQTKANGNLTQLSTTFMFTPKANSKQKRVKKMQERETGRAVREQLGKSPFFTPKSQF
ncbi:hypothetical protein MTR_7g038840 [Medicago truncatula]|uniref:Uncharacterized protein n=1 Tax=Medicago truncatula TaxID=3880 RepID=A0A072TZJ1_MEDTR|nr:hypothetical protein MTR_7g038840 [Medicago truncatula]